MSSGPPEKLPAKHALRRERRTLQLLVYLELAQGQSRSAETAVAGERKALECQVLAEEGLLDWGCTDGARY